MPGWLSDGPSFFEFLVITLRQTRPFQVTILRPLINAMGVTYHTSDSDDPTESCRPFRTDRKYHPAELYGEAYDLDLIDKEKDGWTLVPCDLADPCKRCGQRERHLDCLIVAVDGACRDNGTNSARSAVGVYFAKRSIWNIGAELDDPAPTNQKAELEACLTALRLASQIKEVAMEGLV